VNVYSVIQYLKYILFSSHKRGHGIHSPFVFDLIIKVFRNKINPDIVFKVEMIRKKLNSNKTYVSVADFGTGSEVRDNKLVKVSEIAKKSSVPKKYCKLLAGLSEEFGKPSIIEFGTSFGISTMYLAGAKDNFEEGGLNNIKLFTGSFEQLLPEIENSKIKPGLVFIDGNHRKEPTIDYFNRMADLSDENTVIVLDDIYYSPEMGEAWNEIKQNNRVSITIDIFRMGIVFFREGMTRSDYKIRY